jgi:hypothetical protein
VAQGRLSALLALEIASPGRIRPFLAGFSEPVVSVQKQLPADQSPSGFIRLDQAPLWREQIICR